MAVSCLVESSLAGPVALVGSGEFLPVMADVDRTLLEGRAPRVVFLPTAAAPEGDDTLRYWVELGRQHYTGLGVEPVPLLVRDRADADDPDLAARVTGAGLVYLSGGNPGYLARTLRDTRVWRAIVEAWQSGAALAGCSAGACALTALVNDVAAAGAPAAAGLALVPGLAVVPHFDRIEQWVPGIVDRTFAALTDHVALVGIDEDTALVGRPGEWRVRGRQAAWLLHRDGSRERIPSGERLHLG